MRASARQRTNALGIGPIVMSGGASRRRANFSAH
jgi:hypothetical protein